jgi:hypothetical protein
MPRPKLDASDLAARKRLRELTQRQAFRSALRAELVKAIERAEVAAKDHAYGDTNMQRCFVLGWLIGEAEQSDEGTHPAFGRFFP